MCVVHLKIRYTLPRLYHSSLLRHTQSFHFNHASRNHAVNISTPALLEHCLNTHLHYNSMYRTVHSSFYKSLKPSLVHVKTFL